MSKHVATMDRAAMARMRKRDNAERLGKFQLAVEAGRRTFDIWLDTTKGQLGLGAAVLVLLLIAGLIGR